MKLKDLQKKYPRFVYQNYSYKLFNKDLKIFFSFKIKPDISFRPQLTIKNIPSSGLLRSNLNNFIFQLGLIEMVSYWKATCSPEIEIRCGSLNKEQIEWWQDLIIRGLGQFFFENKINFKKSNFLKIKPSHTNTYANTTIVKLTHNKNEKRQNRILVPVGGGKDSVVTLELMKKAKKDIRCFSLNPTKAAMKIMKVAGCKNPIIVERKIDKKLLELNRKGFLNGHTPFSAYLAFLSVLVAAIFGQKYIAVSNEKSSNEGNVRYLGKIINHQWSKSFEFEQKFRKYSKKYLSRDIEYFSFLRPFYEIQIAKMFSKYPKYFPVFLSCNEAYKTASGTKKPTKKWCGRCSKCLFVFTILYPFLKEKELIKIFGKNLFEDKTLLPIMQQLVGERGFKPFECVGTKKEVRKALNLSIKKAGRFGKLPYLLAKIRNR